LRQRVENEDFQLRPEVIIKVRPPLIPHTFTLNKADLLRQRVENENFQLSLR